MKNRMSLLAVLLFAATSALAQSPVSVRARTPVAELFGGFAYARINDSGTNTNTKGIVGSFAWNARPWLQIVADSSYNKSSYNGVNVKLYGNHYGARVFYRERNKWRVSPFAELLVGGSHVNNTQTGAGGLQYTDLGFSMKAGGGVDFNLTPHFAIRVFDADYYRTSLFSAHQNNIWVSSGLVVRLGGARPE
ncbi:MAG TPA: outer membrane beta-barrel protein [Candidatus Acidoferrum sp.]|nr:outer membrane beta-barrel protein [Candidatus Acidoferrum sp.]